MATSLTTCKQIKYEELPSFSEVFAAGTAAALVPIKSITRYSSQDTFEYIPVDSDEPGPVCVKLLTTLKGIQQGKIADTFGWNSKVEEVELSKYAAAGEEINGFNGGSVDALP